MIAVVGWGLREPVRNKVIEKGALANDAPAAELLDEWFEHATDPQRALLAAWNTGKIVHRQEAIRELGRRVPRAQPLNKDVERMLLAAALDADMEVREGAFSGLRTRNHPALASLAAAQLHDPDPEVRRLGLDFLKSAPAAIGIPLVMPLLDGADPQLTVKALRLIEHWSGQQFGVKMASAIPQENQQNGLKEFSEESRTKAHLGAERAQEWFRTQGSVFAPVKVEPPREALSGLRPIAARDFQLRTLEGKPIRLSSFRGKIVLINFWTTWCTACAGEIPVLIELQKRHADRVAILGISLDYVPDSHGHIGGHGEGGEAGGHGDHSEPDDQATHLLQRSPSLAEVQQKVVRVAQTRGINYAVALDEQNTVGGRFNAGELPTTVILDAKGLVRRRFIGPRPVEVFEAMIDEASRPWDAANCGL